MTVGSGRTLSACCRNPGPLGRCLKILMESPTWASTEFYLTWSGGATKSNRSIYRLVPSTPPTDADDTGLSAAAWMTPQASDDRDRGSMDKTKSVQDRLGRKQINLSMQIPTKATWPTPRHSKTTAEEMETWQKRADAGGVSTPPLGALVKAVWRSPQAGEANGGGQNATERSANGHSVYLRDQLITQASDMARGPATCGLLAQTEKFVVRLTTLSAWLMGYTGAYLALWATASSRKSRKKSSGQS